MYLKQNFIIFSSLFLFCIFSFKVQAVTTTNLTDISAINDLKISKESQSIRLDWSSINGASSYNVYRSTNPYFTPTESERITNTKEPTFSEPVTADNHYYLVRPVSEIKEGEDSNRVGIFNYILYKTASTSYNWIAMPLTVKEISLASDLAVYIKNNSNGNVAILSISSWDNLTQSYHSYLPQTNSGDFHITPQNPYRIEVDVKEASTAIFTLVGDVPKVGSNQDTLRETAGTDYNWIMLPLESLDINASQLAADIENNSSNKVKVEVVSQWNAIAQNYSTYTILPFVTGDFKLKNGYPYRVAVDIIITDNTLWPSIGSIITPTITPTPPEYPHQPLCDTQPKGDFNCDGKIDEQDYQIWKCEYLNGGKCEEFKTKLNADIYPVQNNLLGDGIVDLIEFEIWRRNATIVEPSIVPTITLTITPTPLFTITPIIIPTATPTPITPTSTLTVTPSITPTPTPTPLTKLQAFVTEPKYNGDLIGEAQKVGFGNVGGGLEAADFICNKLAHDKDLTGNFRAWLSSSLVNARGRFSVTNLPVYNASNNQLLLNSINELTQCPNSSAGTNCLQSAFYSKTDQYAWTNTRTDGYINGNNISYSCDNWTTAVDYYEGLGGWTDHVGFQWTNAVYRKRCNTLNSLYCIESPL